MFTFGKKKEKPIRFSDFLENSVVFNHDARNLSASLGLAPDEVRDMGHRIIRLMADDSRRRISEDIEQISSWDVPTKCKVWALLQIGKTQL